MIPRRRVRNFKRTLRWAWRSLGARPAHIIAASSALVLLLALGVWSCQTSPSTPISSRPPLPPRTAPIYTGTEPEIRIRIRQGLDSARITGEGKALVRALPAPGSPAAPVEPRMLPLPLTITILDDGLRLTDGREAPWAYPGAIEISPDPGATLKIEKTRHAGRLRIVPRMGDAAPEIVLASTDPASAEPARPAPPAAPPTRRPTHIDIIETVPLETYIAGVTVSELFSHWSLGAFQIQSICARTYALQQRERAKIMDRDFDLEATVIDQAYHGYTEHQVALQAARETRGMVLTWQGRLLRAYYSSTCGGRTAGAAEIWPTGPGFEFNLDAPIQSTDRDHACQTSTSYTWEVTRSVPELTARMRKWGETNGHRIKHMTAFQSARITETNSTGRPITYEITDIRGQRYTLGAEHLRNACNAAVPGLPEITMKNRARSGDATLQVSGNTVTIRGRGFGHGVGMCQYCAQGMSQRGDTWREMLKAFYPGAKVERVY